MGLRGHEVEQIAHQAGILPAVIPGWVPRSVQNYLDHTENGVPIRALARQQGCHASTVMRQIRRVETLRDDPLIDGMLKTLGETPEPEGARQLTRDKEISAMSPASTTAEPVPNDAELSQHAIRVLRRLGEKGAVLAVATEMEKAVIVRNGDNGPDTRTGVVDRTIAEAMALKGWIATGSTGRITRYQITATGRSALADLMAQQESAQASSGPDAERSNDPHGKIAPRRLRYALAESPLAALARRRDRDGERFLGSDLVRAGERLREDFELAQMGAEATRDWEDYLTSDSASLPEEGSGGTTAPAMAHARVVSAVRDLGPGLSDVLLRCCCFLEGLEAAEKRMGWSARSGKIVLRIALMRLKRHYDENKDPRAPLIG